MVHPDDGRTKSPLADLVAVLSDRRQSRISTGFIDRHLFDAEMGDDGRMSILKRGAGQALKPVRRLNEARFNQLEDLIHAIKNEIVDRLDRGASQSDSLQQALNDQLALQATQLTYLSELGQATRDEIGFARTSIVAELEKAAPSIRLHQLVGARLGQIDQTASAFLNYAHSHQGPLADAGLWINDPVVIEWSEGDARIGAVNERIVEQPFTFAALGQLPPGSRILDLGGGESTVAFSLASSGYHVTVIEPQGYPFTHPNLTVFERPFEEFDRAGDYDAVVLLSAIEHFGIGAYRGNPEAAETADLDTMRLLKDVLKPNGLLVLTTPYGPAAVNELERIYDLDRLQHLLDGWTIGHVNIARQDDRCTWTLEATELEPPRGPNRVMMLTARPTEA